MNTYQTLLSQLGKFPSLVPSETTEQYLTRMVAAVSGMSVESFERLPLEARTWFDTACDNLASGQRLEAPPGFDRELALSPVKPMRIARPVGSAVQAHDTAPPIAPRQGAAAAVNEPLTQTVARLVIREPDLSLDTLMHRLEERNINAPRGSVAAARSSTLLILRLALEAK